MSPTPISVLITDRTQADVSRVRYLQSKGSGLWTSAEEAEWLTDLKGAYNASDLNRVGNALNYLQNLLNVTCGLNLHMEPKIDWTAWDIPTETQMNTYRQQIQQIRDCLSYPAGTANAPDVRYLNYVGANNIEKILQTCDQLITNIQFAFRYTGAAECATGGLL